MACFRPGIATSTLDKSFLRPRCRRAVPFAPVMVILLGATTLWAELNVSMNVDASHVLATMPDVGIGLHTSVYANQFGNPRVPPRIAESGVQLLRYPGGNYASIYHWSDHTATGGYAAGASHFGNFVSRLMDGSGAAGMITVNYGSSHNDTMGGQPKEAAAWVAYANGDAGIYNTPEDIVIGMDEEGNDWRSAGYWANLRTLAPSENPDDEYDFLAIDRDEPVGIHYWEIGNEMNGNGYYSDINGGWNWQNDLHAPPGQPRGNNPLLSPTAYGQKFVEFYDEMKAIDPTIEIGAVLVGPGGVGDMPANPDRDWDRNVLLEAGDVMDFGIIHYYVNNGNSTSAVLNATDDLPALFDEVRDRIDTYVAPGGSEEIGLHMTEFGYFGSVSSLEIDGLFAANTYATFLSEGLTSVHWLELSKSSFLGDDFAQTRGGAFYGIQLFSRIAEIGAKFVQSTSTEDGVETHATVLPNGTVGILIANLLDSSSNDAIVAVNIEGTNLGQSGTEWLYGVNQTTPLETDVDGGLGNNFVVNIPYRSIMALVVDAAANLPGDYNGDGSVNAADFTVWRNSLGQRGNGLPADGNGSEGIPDGIVDHLDYELWKSRYGRSFGQSASRESAIPEPATAHLCLALLVLCQTNLLGFGAPEVAQ